MSITTVKVERGNDLYFPQGNERGDYYEPLWIASRSDGRKFHGRTPALAEAAARAEIGAHHDRLSQTDAT